MILPFSTQLNGKPTYFVEKILSCLVLNRIITFDVANKILETPYQNFDRSIIHTQKLHTLRDDVNDRWHAGGMIDYFINVRQKNMFRFAPKVPVVSTQKVYMTYKFGDVIEISIDDKYLMSYTERLEFAINDGFDNWEDFFNYFYPKIKAAPGELYKPKLIHWTDFKY